MDEQNNEPERAAQVTEEVLSLMASEVLPIIAEIQATLTMMMSFSDESIQLKPQGAATEGVPLHTFLQKLTHHVSDLEAEIKKVRDEGKNYRKRTLNP
jgi:hypothetical protein